MKLGFFFPPPYLSRIKFGLNLVLGSSLSLSVVHFVKVERGLDGNEVMLPES